MQFRQPNQKNLFEQDEHHHDFDDDGDSQITFTIITI